MTGTIDSCHSGSYQSRNGPIRSKNGESLKGKKLANPSPRITAPDRQLPLTIDVKDYKIINSGIGRRKGLKIPRWLSNVPVRVRPSAFIFNKVAHLKLYFLLIVFLFFPYFSLFIGNVRGHSGNKFQIIHTFRFQIEL